MSRILYVEDHPAERDILAQMLELNGYEVSVASDGVEGVEKARAWLPDLIIMDLRMPRMDGFEATKIIRSEEETAHIPIIASSAWASVKHKERALAVGANEHFSKPVDLNRLLTTIGRYLKDEDSVEELEERRQIELSEAEIEAVYAEKMELTYQLEIWQNCPELASTLEHLTRLTSGIVHDLRNRLGILQNYTLQANYCLRLLDSLAFLRFKPSLSRQPCKGHLAKPEILAKDLMEFDLDKFEVQISLLKKKRGKTNRTNSVGMTVKGLVDTQMLSRGLWLFLQSITGHFFKPEKNQMTLSSKKPVIRIEDKRPRSSTWGFYITISAPSEITAVLPKNIDLSNVLLGDEVTLCLFLLQKAAFLNSGEISIDETGEIDIRVRKISSGDKNVQALKTSTNGLTPKVMILSTHYNGPEPNIHPLIKGFVAAISRELDNIAAEANSETNGISNEKSRRIILRNCRYAQLLLQNLVWLGVGIELPKEPVNLADTLLSVREIMRGEIRERTDDDDEDDDFIEVKLELEPDLPPVSANQVSLQQVFMNLITNALETMPESGLLTLQAFQADSEIHAEVCDTGNGISPENINHIFDLAFSTKKGQERGTGLHIVKSIVDKLGGRIEVTSKPGVGTTFRVCLQKC